MQINHEHAGLKLIGGNFADHGAGLLLCSFFGRAARRFFFVRADFCLMRCLLFGQALGISGFALATVSRHSRLVGLLRALLVD
jgi:hypothetical protein